MKRLLIISPYFPPANAADCHRVRISLPYFEKFGWKPEVVTVDDSYTDLLKDQLLLKSIPDYIKIHKVMAFSKKWTSKVGLGSLALRSLWFYLSYVNKLLKLEKFDLIYFSTTQFPVCVLGAYWKRKFNVPYVIDVQDPWHTLYYQNKPKAERPPKYWFSYRLNKYLEPIAIKNVDGLISVNRVYLTELKKRYTTLTGVPSAIIPFCCSFLDFEIAAKHKTESSSNFEKNGKLKLVYIGAVGTIMKETVTKLLLALKNLLEENEAISENIALYFLGTSYSANGTGEKSVEPIAKALGLEKYTFEKTDRIGYFNSINHLLASDALLLIGSDDADYLGSKLYNLLHANKKIFSILHENSPANKILKNYHSVTMCTLQQSQQEINKRFTNFLMGIGDLREVENEIIYHANTMTKNQCYLFDKVVRIYS